MPNAMGVGNLVQMRLWVVNADQASVNTWWYKVAAVGASPATDADMAANLDSLVNSTFKSWMSSNSDYRGVQCTLCDPVGPYKPLFNPAISIAHAGPGTSGAADMPRQVAGLIRFLTIGPGRARMGRMYIPFPIITAANADGTVTTAAETVLQAIADELYTGIGLSTGGRTATLVRCIVHHKNKAGIFLDPSPVTERLVSPNFATQRKRGEYGRKNGSPF